MPLRYLYISITLLLANNINCQNLEEFKNHSWGNSTSYFKHQTEEEAIIGVKDKIIINFEYNDNGHLIEYDLIHKAFILNSDEEIEAYNKLYLPSISSTTQLEEIKARVIKKNGDINVLDKDKILSSKDEETNIESKYYAFEGVEKGSIIEYYYILKKSPVISGKKIKAQHSYLNKNYEFDLYCPLNLIFKFKSYNNLPEIIRDTNTNDKNHWQLNLKTINKLDHEEQSAYSASKMSFIYKLDRNTATNSYDISSYSSVANRFYNKYYSAKSKNELKAVRKLINGTDCKIARNKWGEIRAIEDYLKSTIYTVSTGNDDLYDISKIIINKIASDQGMINLYVAIFNELEIKHQIVLTSNRFDLKFDKKFEASNFLTDCLFYFPDLKAYLSPTSINSRLGFPPMEFTNTYGLFIKEININNMKTGLAKVKFIEAVDYKKNFSDMIINIDLDTNDISKSIVKFDRSSAGYNAINIQPFMNFYADEDKMEILDDYIKSINEDISIINKTVFYDDAKYFGIEPFKVSSEFYLDPFIEKAGKTIILKVGNLIGPQTEMYQEKERILPLENQFNRNYHRVITINIPEKYKINNLDALTINNEYVKDSETLMSFKSSFTFENNTLTVIVDEYYNLITIEPILYNTYRKIINSAADFNKVSLILE